MEHFMAWASASIRQNTIPTQESQLSGRLQTELVDSTKTDEILLKIIIASRPETHFRFQSALHVGKNNNGSRLSINHDIRLFIADKFDEIKTQRPLRAYIPDS